MAPPCPPGKIRRDAYTAHSAKRGTYHVPSACITDVGKPGKTPKSERIEAELDVELEPYGYAHISAMKADDRHASLQRAIRDMVKTLHLDEHTVAVKVMRYLNLLSIYNRNTNKTVSEIQKRDRNWIGRHYLGKDYASAQI